MKYTIHFLEYLTAPIHTKFTRILFSRHAGKSASEAGNIQSMRHARVWKYTKKKLANTHSYASSHTHVHTQT